MKAIQWFGPHDMRLVDMPRPEPRPHEVLVRVESVGVCGSDLHYYEGGRIGSARITEPLVLGHEYAGIVEAAGAQVDPALVGKRVAVEPGIPCMRCEWCRTGHYNVCRDMSFPGGPPYHGALCEYMAVHAAFCYPVPDTMTAAEAAMVEPVAVAVHTVELAAFKPGETAAVLGLGPIGLLTARIAQICGVSILYGTDLHDYRLDAARMWGVDKTCNAARQDSVQAIMEWTGGRGVDVAFDTARSADTPAVACRVARPAGRCVLTGISGNNEDPFPVSACRHKELVVKWCRRFRHNYPAALSLIASGRLDVRPLLTHSFPLERAGDAFELVSGFRDGVIKASVDF